MLVLGELAERAAFLRDVPAHDDRAATLAIAVAKRCDADFVNQVAAKFQCLREIEVFRLQQDVLRFREVVPQHAAHELPLRLAEHLGGPRVRADNAVPVVEHDDRIAYVVEQRAVAERTELENLQRQRSVNVQRQKQHDGRYREREFDRPDAEHRVA